MAYTKTEWVSGETKLSADNMNHIENGITTIDNNLSSLWIVKKQSVTGTIDTGTESQGMGFEVAGTVASYTGYTPIGVVGWQSDHGKTCRVGSVNLNGSTLSAYGANNGQATSLTITFHVLYMKNL